MKRGAGKWSLTWKRPDERLSQRVYSVPRLLLFFLLRGAASRSLRDEERRENDVGVEARRLFNAEHIFASLGSSGPHDDCSLLFDFFLLRVPREKRLEDKTHATR